MCKVTGALNMRDVTLKIMMTSSPVSMTGNEKTQKEAWGQLTT